MEFETASARSGDKKMQVEGGQKKNKAQKELDKQNDLIKNALKMGENSHKLSQQANLELRS